MSRLQHTSSLHSLLQSVAERKVTHHSGCGAWTVGWSWADGGHMTDETQDVAEQLKHAGLIAGTGECLGVLTFAGSERLSQWNETYSKGRAA